MQWIGVPTLQAVRNWWIIYSHPALPILYLLSPWFYISRFATLRLYSAVYLTMEKKSLCKWTHTVLTHVVQGWWLFSHSVLSDSLRPHGLQHTRLPCPSLSPGVCSTSCPLSQWCLPTIASSVIPFFSCPQSSPGPKSRFFLSGGQSIRASASASVLPMNIQGWFPLDWLVWFLCYPRNSQESSPAPQFESINSSVLNLFYGPTLASVHAYWKNHSFD